MGIDWSGMSDDELERKLNELQEILNAQANKPMVQIPIIYPGAPVTNNGPKHLEVDWNIWSDQDKDPLKIGGKCECGSSAVGSTKHSDYCPKYVK